MFIKISFKFDFMMWGFVNINKMYAKPDCVKPKTDPSFPNNYNIVLKP